MLSRLRSPRHLWRPALLILILLGGGFYYHTQIAPAQTGETDPAAQSVTDQAAAPTEATATPDDSLPVDPTPSLETILRALRPAAQPIVSQELVATDLVSRNHLGLPLDHAVTGVALSADGQIVAFAARAGNLRPDDAPPAIRAAVRPTATPDHAQLYEQIYVLDRSTNRLELITRGRDGLPGNGWSSAPALSPDGRFVAFYSWASNLVDSDTNAVQDAFLYDRTSATMTRVSVSTTGQQGNDRTGDSRPGVRPALSADGTLIAFHSRATNLVDDPVAGTTAETQVYLHNRVTRATTLISRAADGTPADNDALHPAISADGHIIAFQSRAPNLFSHLDAPTPASGADSVWQIWRVELDADAPSPAWTLISQTPDGTPGNGDSTWPALDATGDRLAFQTAATNLVQPDTNNAQDILVYTATPVPSSPALQRVSVSSMGISGNRDSSTPALAAEGRFVAFVAAATNLVNGDTNNATDIFLHDLESRHTSRISVGVTAPWTGVEADGPSTGPAALSANGEYAAFVAQSTALLATAGHDPDDDRVLPAQAWLHTRRTLPGYTLAGRITENNGQPVAGVRIRAGAHTGTTDAQGYYQLPGLVRGTYAVTADHSRYSFSPLRRVISLLDDTTNVNFTGFAGVDQTRAFLDLPIPYDGSVTTFLQALRDTTDGGLVDAWFDHAYPDYSKTGSLTLWDGTPRATDLYNEDLGCYQRRCYDGHDGVDFPYRAHLVDRSLGPFAIPVLPAAPGRVVAVVTQCPQADVTCNRGYGNEVILAHDNGYFTRYSHLEDISVQPGDAVTRANRLGRMGSTGNSNGIHLHFAVHWDDGDGRWNGESVDLPVDPFGWSGSQPDPWVADRGGPVSRWLWLHHPTAETVLVGSMGGTLRDVAGNLEITFPTAAFAGQARLELEPSAPAGPVPANRRSIGRGFWLRVLEWIDHTPPDEIEPSQVDPTFAAPYTLQANLTELDLRHLDADALTWYRWSPSAQSWQPLPTQLDPINQTATLQSDQPGYYDLQAPLRCPQDTWEPDDDYFRAIPLVPAPAPIQRLLHSPEDEDWFRVEGVTGSSYRATLDGRAPGFLPALTLFDADGVTALAHADAAADTEAILLDWTLGQTGSDATGAVYLRVRAQPAGITGCDARYHLRVEAAP